MADGGKDHLSVGTAPKGMPLRLQLLSQLAADGLVTAAPLQWPKGSTWLLQRTAPPQVRGRYLAPLILGSLMEIG